MTRYSSNSENTLSIFREFIGGRNRGPIMSMYHQPDYRQQADPELMVSRACKVIRSDLDSAGSNTIPIFCPDFGTVSVSSIWGGKIVCPEDGNKSIEPVATSIGDFMALGPAHSFDDSDFGLAIRLYGRICKKLGTDDIFIRTPDLQGPMNTLAQLVPQEELLCALIENPDGVKQALASVTDVIIGYVGKYREIIGLEKVIGNSWPYVVLPDGNGISITQDYMPLMSPEQYRDIEMPFLKKIADSFGGVFIHCCGAYSQHLPALANADFKIIGIEVHYPYTDIRTVYSHLKDKVFYVPYCSEQCQKEFDGYGKFLDFIRPECRDARLWVAMCHGWCDEKEVMGILDGWHRITVLPT